MITIQTEGASNLDAPVPACFPNLPDPALGRPLAPGERSWLHSFNHDTGRPEGVGAMTVSAGGRLICTGPGVGILAPGWHAPGHRRMSFLLRRRRRTTTASTSSIQRPSSCRSSWSTWMPLADALLGGPYEAYRDRVIADSEPGSPRGIPACRQHDSRLRRGRPRRW